MNSFNLKSSHHHHHHHNYTKVNKHSPVTQTYFPPLLEDKAFLEEDEDESEENERQQFHDEYETTQDYFGNYFRPDLSHRRFQAADYYNNSNENISDDRAVQISVNGRGMGLFLPKVSRIF